VIDFFNTNFNSLYCQRDEQYFEELEKLLKENNITLPILLQNYMAFIRRREFAQTIAYVHLFEMVKDIPGSIAELGVFLGNGLFTWSKLLETYCPGVRGRKVFGFDSFLGYQAATKTEEQSIQYIESIHGHNFEISEGLVKRLISLNEGDNIVMGAQRIKLYSGDVKDSIDRMKSENPGVRFALVMIDLNLFEPTSFALEKIYADVVRGGVVAFRGYGVTPWEGESAAVDAFVVDKNQTLKSFSYSPYPGAYLQKR
jgi:hypothetical protein